MAQQQQGISLAQSSQGGIIDDIDVNIIDAAFCEYDYQGAIDHNILALGIQLKDESGKTYDQYYSAGELTYFVPSDDGGMAVPVADKQLLTDTCNAWKFLASLMESGLPDTVLAAGNVKALVGMRVHVKQQAQPKRSGLIRGGKNADREPTVLLVSAILSMPGQDAQPVKKSSGIAGAGKPVQGRPTQAAPATKPGLGRATTPVTTAPAPAHASAKSATSPSKPNGAVGASTVATNDDDKAVAADILNGILTESGGSVTKKDLAKLAFQKAGEKVNAGELDIKAKTRIVQLIFQDAFLHELATGGGIAFDGATVSFPG